MSARLLLFRRLADRFVACFAQRFKQSECAEKAAKLRKLAVKFATRSLVEKQLRNTSPILVPIALFSSLSRQGLGTRIEGALHSRANMQGHANQE